MSEKKIPHSSATDEPEPPNYCQVDRSANTAPGCRNMNELGQRNGEAASSSPESGSVNGDGKRSGKSRRRRKRSSNPESHTEGKVDAKTSSEENANGKLPDPRTVLIGLQAERAHVWFERGTYERAESFYQCWLASSSHGTSPLAPRKQPPPKSPSSVALWCHHEEQVACHHVVEEVWVNKWTFDQAERSFTEDSAQPCVPNSLELAPPADRSIAPTVPDEGYQSLAPTPATPVVPPTSRQSINGLPRFPVELLRDVWLEKLLYDRAEAAFYQNLYGNNSNKRCSSAATSRSSDHPQCLVEEEEEEQDEEELVGGETRPLQLCKAEVFHALHPIQEEEEPAEVPPTEDASGLGLCYFLHPDSEHVWLEKWRYDAAESHFHGHRGAKAAVVKKSQRPEADASSMASLRDNTMSAADFLAQEKIWFDKPRYDEAERRFYEHMNGGARPTHTPKEVGANTILQDIARARENIQKSLAGSSSSNNGGGTADQGELVFRIKSLELENQSLHKVVEDLSAALSKLECRVAVLEKSPAAVAPAPVASTPYTNGTTVQQTSSSLAEEEEDDDDDIDLFGSDDDEEAEKLKEQRLKAYAEKKAKKPVLIAKSSILLDVKPWDDETDMVKLEECVRSVQADGLLWGTSKLVPVGYGIKKLQIACVVEDDKVGTDILEEEITKFEDYVQSVDVAAFNKI